MSTPAVETFDLRKVYNEEKVAVQGLTLRVERGEVFGYLGPNGAGKTTSIKMLLGLVRPSAGSGFLLGQPIGRPETRVKVGFLPEHFRFHEWMHAAEFLEFHGKLYGLSRAERAQRIPQLIGQVGLVEAGQRRLSTYSKGMLQRVGLAMALLPRPEIVFLDEPTSGLDPFGRILVRDVIKAARDEGTAVFLNSHLLSEIETTCDRVAFIRQGRVVQSGRLADLAAGSLRVSVRLGHVPGDLLPQLEGLPGVLQAQAGDPQVLDLRLRTEEDIPPLTAWLVGQGLAVYAITPQRVTLEQLFVQIMSAGGPDPGSDAALLQQEGADHA